MPGCAQRGAQPPERMGSGLGNYCRVPTLSPPPWPVERWPRIATPRGGCYLCESGAVRTPVLPVGERGSGRADCWRDFGV